MAIVNVLCVMVTEDSLFDYNDNTEQNLKFLTDRFGQEINKDNLYNVLDEQAEQFNCSIVDLDVGDPVDYIKSTNDPETHGQEFYDKFVNQAEKFWLEHYEGHAYCMYDVTYEYDQIIMIILDDDNMDDDLPLVLLCVNV